MSEVSDEAVEIRETSIASYSQEYDEDSGFESEAASPLQKRPAQVQQQQHYVSALPTPSAIIGWVPQPGFGGVGAAAVFQQQQPQAHAAAHDAAAISAAVGQRLSAALDKRRRAEARRIQYISELATTEAALAAATKAHLALQGVVTDLQAEIGSYTSMVATKEEALEVVRALAQQQEQQIGDLKLRFERAQAQTEDVRAAAAAASAKQERAAADLERALYVARAQHAAEMAAARAEMERVQQAAVAERGVLPEHHKALLEHHKALLDTEIDRVKRWEEQVRASQLQLQVRQEHAQAEAAKARRDAQLEAMHAHTLAKEGLEGDRKALQADKQALVLEREEWRASVSAAEARMDSKAAATEAAAARLEEERRQLTNQKAAFTTRAALLAPHLQQLAREQAELRSSREKCSALMAQLKLREDDIGEREARLAAREQHTSGTGRVHTANAARVHGEQRDAVLNSDQRESTLRLEQQRMARLQVDMSAQACQLERGVALLRRAYIASKKTLPSAPCALSPTPTKDPDAAGSGLGALLQQMEALVDNFKFKSPHPQTAPSSSARAVASFAEHHHHHHHHQSPQLSRVTPAERQVEADVLLRKGVCARDHGRSRSYSPPAGAPCVMAGNGASPSALNFNMDMSTDAAGSMYARQGSLAPSCGGTAVHVRLESTGEADAQSPRPEELGALAAAKAVPNYGALNPRPLRSGLFGSTYAHASAEMAAREVMDDARMVIAQTCL